ncbi:hypothetical protein QE177_09045 [Arsenophonus sp. aPb]|uniref:hypothetical protein n=1 Tax=Arsenophonus sp. aPb TaxID=3041619 RepID=UPI002469AC83|nr:hypothetical protein [Arsenophonus sp. aPb]WGL97368.1 hypothetical protein QE177_09045 [Arsenophonus sp. aPb]
MKIFWETVLFYYLQEKKALIIDSINKEQDDYLLNVNELDYVRYKSDEAKVEPLEIYEDKMYVSSYEKMISAERFSRSYLVNQGISYKKNVIRFHIPFSGDKNLLGCSPSTKLVWTVEVEVSNQEITFEIINYNNNKEQISNDKDSIMRGILEQARNVSKDVNIYNSGINAQIKDAFEFRKRSLLKKNNVLASLGIPIKKSCNISSTFSVSALEKRKKISVVRPQVTESVFTPEPCLDKNTYEEILKLIHDVGKVFERLPSLYANKEEEHLRDHFLMMLEPNFAGSATGETFNKKGKTDILLRYDGHNVFIAECKFWRGKKGFLDTISQLLGYLTWRDSKAAVIMFVSNKDFTSVIKTSKDEITQHPNFIKFLGTKDDTWLNYIFHLNNDRNRLVNLAIMLYHIPK